MKNLFYIFLARPVTAAMFFFSVVVLGVVSILNLPVELTPHAEYPKLTVQCSWANASSVAMEANITAPLEAELATIKGVKKITSESSKGSSRIELEFHPGIDMEMTRIEINEKFNILRDELPYGVYLSVSPYVPEEFTDLQGFLTYTLSGNESASKIRKYVKENLIYPLKSIKGVSDVEVYGGNDREIVILIDYKKAASLGVTNYEIQNAVKNSERLEYVGTIKRNGARYFVKLNNRIKSVKTIENQPVKFLKDGNTILVKDIARVIDDFKPAWQYYRIDGKETVTLEISKEPGANAIKVADNVKAKIKELSKEFPPSYVIQNEVDKTEEIVKQIDELVNSALFSLIIIILVLIAIFRSLRYAFVIVLSIFFSLLFSFLLFYVFELSLNVLTISAFVLGFGFMVDNSIVVVDYIDRHINERNIKRLTIILKNIFFPVFASTLTTVAVFLPLLFLSGELRIYLTHFALGILFTITASMIVAFTIIPLCYFKFNFGRKLKEKELHNSLGERIYISIISFIYRFKKTVAAFLIIIIGLPVWLIPSTIETPYIAPAYNYIFDSGFYNNIRPYVNLYLGGALNLYFNKIDKGEFWRWGDQTYLRVSINMPNGNDIERINEIVKKFEKEILSYKGSFKSVVSRVLSEERAFINIYFTKNQSFTAFPYQLKNFLVAYATRMGGLSVGVYGYGPGFYNGGGGSSSSFSVKVLGFNFNKVKNIAEQFKNIIKRNRRIPEESIDIDKANLWRNKDVFEIVGYINRDKLSSMDISVEELISYINKTTIGDIRGSKFKIDNEAVLYNIKYTNYKNIQLDEVKDLIIKTKDGKYVKVADVVDFDVKKVMSLIRREDQQYVRYITYEYKGPYKYGKKFLDKSLKEVVVPEGYIIKANEFFWMFTEEEEEQVLWILLASVILIFMITSSLFESYKKPSIILLAIPFAFVGTLFTFYYGEFTMNRGAYAGMLLLVGLSVNNSIILVDYLSKFKITGLKKVAELSYTRIRPIFTTSVTTIAALVPLLAGAETSFWKSLSLSVMGGIFFSAIIVILIVPVVYYILSSGKKK